MIIVNLTGGLGNQMFQYAFGRMLAHKNKTNLKVHFTNALLNTKRSYGLDIFKISGTKATDADLKKMNIVKNRIINRLFYLLDERYGIQFNHHIKTQRFPYKFDQKYLLVKDDSYLQGYWHDERFFSGIQKIIQKEFILKKRLDTKNLSLIKLIKESESVSIHVRRSDYVTNKSNIPQFIGVDYYLKAIKEMNRKIRKPVFFIFSDDILWCRENFSFLEKAYFIDHNKGDHSYKDLVLMSQCRHNIVANSTFSWWASWLNRNESKIVIKP